MDRIAFMQNEYPSNTISLAAEKIFDTILSGSNFTLEIRLATYITGFL